jgi:SAM-dependent methyltransferase
MSKNKKMEEEENPIRWDEHSSRAFLDYGRYLVPGREEQIRTLCALIPARPEPFYVLELACGEGLLAQEILERYPTAILHGYDGSVEMLRAAESRLARWGERFQARAFDLAEVEWRSPAFPFQAVVSSLAVHHLDGLGKRELFRDIFALLAPGGALLIADIVQPAGPQGAAFSADTYDAAVRQRSLELAGNTEAFDFFVRERWNLFRYPDDPIDRPSTLFEQLQWLEAAGFGGVDAFWMQAGHAIFGGYKTHPPAGFRVSARRNYST